MRYSEKMVVEKVSVTKDLLEQALGQIDSIKKEDRTDMVDKLLGAAADSIYEAQRWLEKIDMVQYDSSYPSEHIRVRRQRIVKTPKVENES
jgi:hypothetical protein